MTTYTLTVSHAVLKALLIHAGEKDLRRYLNGVAVDLTDPGDPVLVATDGYHLLSVRVIEHSSVVDASIVQSGSIPAHCTVIPRGLIKAFKPAKSARGAVTITLSDWDDTAQRFQRVTLSDITGTSSTDETIEGRFPDWRRVMPSTTDALQFAPDARRYRMNCLSDTVDALTLLGVVSEKTPALPDSAGVWLPVNSEFPDADERRIGLSGNLTMPETRGVRFVIAPRHK